MYSILIKFLNILQFDFVHNEAEKIASIDVVWNEEYVIDDNYGLTGVQMFQRFEVIVQFLGVIY